MSGTISFTGVGSNLDTDTIVTGLVNASKGPLQALQSRSSDLSAANTSLSGIATLLGKLQTALEAVDETKEIGSYSASSSNSAVVASALGSANPGSYNVDVKQLAAEQRTYSDGYDSSSTALGLTGDLNVSVAGGAAKAISLDSTDTLETIASKINASGQRVSASIFNDGTKSYLQVRGLDTGKANNITFSGTTLGLDADGANRQEARDSEIYIDNFKVTRSNNQVMGAIAGVTLNLTNTTAAGSPAIVKIASDPDGLAKKLNTVVAAYNAVVDQVHTVAGFGSTKGSVDALAGDSLLRTLTNRMSGALGSQIGTGNYTTLGSIGMSVDRTGHLTLDSSKLSDALTADPANVAKVLAGPDSGAKAGTGVADILRDIVKTFNAAGTGLLASRQTALQTRIKDTNDAANREQDRLDAYAEQLKKQFTNLDGIMSSSSQDLSYLANFFK